MKKKILVTGGAGYIGAHSCIELITAGYEPIIVDNLSRSDTSLLAGIEKITGQKPEFAKCDCNDKSALSRVFAEFGPIAAVMHFAAYKSVGESVKFPLLYYRNNVGSLVTLLEVMQECNVSDLIFSSSCTVYGQPDHIPVDENAPFKKPESPYGASKQVCEQLLNDTYKTGVRIVSLRYFNPIGAHPTAIIGELPIGTPSNLVPYITQTAIGKRESLTVFGGDYQTPDGTCIRDYIHVVDLSNAHVKAIQYLERAQSQPCYLALNLGTGIGVSVLQLIREFTEVTNCKLPYTIGPRRPGDVEKVYGSPEKANLLLGWTTKYSSKDALLHAWNWEKYLAQLSK